MTALLDVAGVTRRFGGLVAVSSVDLQVRKGEVLGLIGPNGSGKSTLVNLIAGTLPVSAGKLTLHGRDITGLPAHKRARLGLARSFQLLRLFPTHSVEDNLLLARHPFMRTSLLDSLIGRRSAIEEEQAARARAREILALFDLAEFATRPASALSIGQQRMVELARGMFAEPTLFLLDEPAAGLSPPNVARLIEQIRNMRDAFGISVLLVEHVMDVVRGICDRVVVLDHGEVIALGQPDVVMQDPAVVAAYIGTGRRRRAAG